MKSGKPYLSLTNRAPEQFEGRSTLMLSRDRIQSSETFIPQQKKFQVNSSFKPWPNGLASRRKSTASLQNQNLRTNLRRLAKWIRKSAS